MLVDVTNPITNWIFPPRCTTCSLDISCGSLCSICAVLITKASKTSSVLHHKKPALFFYEGTIKKLVVRAKFNHRLEHAHVLMQLVRDEFHKSSAMSELEITAPDAITFVPTHWRNRVQRGVDLPQLFALTLAKIVSLPVVSCLRRASFHRQTLLTRKIDRQIGITGAFSLKTLKTYERLLVVDDVVTTGATFDESKKVLKKISEEIFCLAIARTP